MTILGSLVVSLLVTEASSRCFVMPAKFKGTLVDLLPGRVQLKLAADGKTAKVCCSGCDDSVTR